MCRSQRMGDMQVCGYCGLTWDIADPDRPSCRDPREEALRQREAVRGMSPRQVINYLKELVSDE